MPEPRSHAYNSDFTPHLYLQQLARSWRFLERYRRSSTHKPGGPRSSYYDSDDNLWAFFQHCWHVKDWLKHDTSVESTKRSAVIDAVHASGTLQVIRDLANGSKHLLDPGASGAEDSGMRIHDHEDGSSSFIHLIRLDRKDVPATELAARALGEWRAILKAHDLEYFAPPD